jgi:hypothetical protein
MRPIGIPRDLEDPLPYIAMLMELGTEAEYQGTGSKIKCTPSTLGPDEFGQLRKAWMAAVKAWENYRNRKKKTQEKTKQLRDDVKAKRRAMDSCNRYTIAVRGASPEVYGILREAKMVGNFATFLKVTMSSPPTHEQSLQHIRPLERLVGGHKHWMREYVISSDEEE